MNTDLTIYRGEEPEPKKPFFTPTRVLVGGLALGALGFGIYKYFDWKSKQQQANQGDNFLDNEKTTEPPPSAAPKKTPTSNTTSPTTTTPKKPESDFPIKRGTRSEKIKHLQEVLIQKFGKGVLPKYGADGQYGSELEKALTEKGIPTNLTEEQYLILTQIDDKDTATKLYNAVSKKDFSTTLAVLKSIRNTSDYKKVGEAFKGKKLNGVTTTVVTGVLKTFDDPAQKQVLQLEFSRMGLKYDGQKWSNPDALSGTPIHQLKTLRSTQVWINAKHPLLVGENVILGNELFSSDGFTHFETVDGIRLYVLTSHVAYL